MNTKENRVVRMENPFNLKVGQVFTGFGIGCGIGIGVGRPLNLGAIPVLNQIMVATRGATDAFSDVGRHVNNSLRKVGAKNLEAGIGCGVGFGHGFGVGLAVKPGVVHKMQSNLLQAVTHVMMKLGISPGLFVDQGILPASLRSGINMVKEPSHDNPIGSMGQLVKSIPNSTEQGNIGQRSTNENSSVETLAPETDAVNTQSASRVEKVISNFFENPLLKEERGKVNEKAEKLQSQNNMLQMVLKHQLLIEELMRENEKLCQILIEELKVPPKIGSERRS
ncbi:uncharacterized protein LOC111377701 isoform X2 [Olea europaea var. sylvestris]|uniref:uncharacterized protein LOC111377701 isoform X2 n=1 Tax=Olea europaea var. sylvestris TaxID=158386 RepID=UPI000C1D2268|nr:uncharacterized protein LOC111377701 isoform X2 [Olea europaea var. sylvestris]